VTAGLDKEDRAKLKKDAQAHNLAASFMLNLESGRYGRLIEDLENNFLQGQDRWPKTLTVAFSLLMNWKQTTMQVMDSLICQHRRTRRGRTQHGHGPNN
jgi:hypothetical protein